MISDLSPRKNWVQQRKINGRQRLKGQPKVVAIEDLDRNLLASDISIGEYKVTARQYSFGFSFGL